MRKVKRVLKRENIGGKYYNVVRLNGKISDKNRWGKDKHREDLIGTVKEHNTLSSTKDRQVLNKAVMITDTGKKPEIIKGKPQYWVTTLRWGKDKNNVVHASSKPFSSVSESELRREESAKRALQMLGFATFGEDHYTERDGEEALQHLSNVKATQGVRRFVSV